MLAVCAEAGAGLPVTPVLALAESTGLGDVHAGLVLLADAAHWVRPDAAGPEARRLLAPDGVAAVVAPEPLDTPFMRGLRALLIASNPKARSLPQTPRTRQFLALAAGPGRPREERFEQRAVLAPEALRRVVRSLSYGGPALGPARLERLSSRWGPSASARAASGPGRCGFPGSGSGGVHAGLEGVHLGGDRGGDDACRRVVEGRAPELLRPEATGRPGRAGNS